jgi:outer membrane protein TolC
MGAWDMRRALALSFLWAVCIGAAAPAAADTIDGALIAAYQNNPALNSQGGPARGRAPQMWAGAHPRRDGAAVPRPPDVAGALASLMTYDDYQAAKAAATEQTVLLKAATAFMDLLRDGALLELQRRNVEVLQEQLRQTRDSFIVGKVADADVAQAESGLASGRATVLAAEAQYAKSKATYRLTIGVEPNSLQPASPVDRLSPPRLVLAIELARARHPDVGAATFGDVDTARELVEANVVSAWGAVEGAKARILATTAKVAAAEIALKDVREQARVGQRVTLDVLNAQQEFVNTRVALVTAQHDRVVASYQVLAAVGQLNLAKLGIAKPGVTQPDRPFDRAID